MNDIDTNLRLLSGEPWEINGIGTIFSPSLREIVRLGFMKYIQHVNVLTVDAEDALSLDDESEDSQTIKALIEDGTIKGFDCIFKAEDETVSNMCLEAITFFFKSEGAYYSKEQHIVYIIENGLTSQKRFIDRDKYEEIKKVIKLIACRDDDSTDDIDENPADERAAKIIEKLRKSREILREIKKREASENEDGTDIFDIISAISTRSNSLNKITVWDLTLYQLFDEFKRLQVVDQYDSGILAMMQIGDKITVKHWSTKYQDKE